MSVDFLQQNGHDNQIMQGVVLEPTFFPNLGLGKLTYICKA